MLQVHNTVICRGSICHNSHNYSSSLSSFSSACFVFFTALYPNARAVRPSASNSFSLLPRNFHFMKISGSLFSNYIGMALFQNLPDSSISISCFLSIFSFTRCPISFSLRPSSLPTLKPVLLVSLVSK